MVGGCHRVPSHHFSGFLCCYTSGAFLDLKKDLKVSLPAEPAGEEDVFRNLATWRTSF